MMCDCKPTFTIEPHGLDDYVLYYGRCKHQHGYNLVILTEPAFNFNPKHLEKLINLGNDVYQQNPDGEYLAE